MSDDFDDFDEVDDDDRGAGLGGGRLGEALDTLVAVTLFAAAVVMVTRFFGWSVHPFVVLMQASLPVSMLPIWVAAAVAVWRRLPVRFVLAVGLMAAHVLALAPALGSDDLPEWALATGEAAPVRVRLLAANVFEGNLDGSLVPALLAARADVMVLVEVSVERQVELADAGAFRELPFLVQAGNIRRKRILIASRYPVSVSGVAKPGGTATPVATLKIGTRSLKVVGSHPSAPLYRGAISEQRAWFVWAREQARVSTEPIVLAGDFNASRFVPAMGELFAAGLTDAHEARGRGLSTSWPVGGAFFDLPFMRLDHVLYRGDVVATAVRDLTLPGSDHLGIVADLALR